MTRLGQPARLVTIERHPHVQFVIETLGSPPEMYSPLLILSRQITQRLKGNSNFNCISIIGHKPFRLHNNVETEIFVLSLAPDAVGLHAQRIEVKLICLAMVVERIKQNAYIIVVPNIVSFGNICSHLPRFVITVKSDVERFGIVAKQYLSGICWCNIVARLNLIKILQHRSIFPNLVIEFPVNYRYPVKTWKFHRLGLLWWQDQCSLTEFSV